MKTFSRVPGSTVGPRHCAEGQVALSGVRLASAHVAMRETRQRGF